MIINSNSHWYHIVHIQSVSQSYSLNRPSFQKFLDNKIPNYSIRQHLHKFFFILGSMSAQIYGTLNRVSDIITGKLISIFCRSLSVNQKTKKKKCNKISILPWHCCLKFCIQANNSGVPQIFSQPPLFCNKGRVPG